ncbi:MAG TPA: DEAD/DEAH box helicase, partial [Firmicutes bacterium]|nr:DEAD/DEAH box helicase [Bacillota bacterium]
MGEGQIEGFLPLLQILKSSKSYKKNIISVITYPFAKGKWIDISFLPENLRKNLLNIGIERLYPYQKRVYQTIKERKNVAIVSPTASGKTLSFHLPIIEFLERGEKAIYVYPTKALTRDQERQLKRYSKNIKFGIYDGDTPIPKRRLLRRTSQVILTNPEMIHYSILPYHTSWNLFLSRISFVVFDEAHLYSGIFGSNVSSLIRRMKRVFSFYGRKVNFIFS